MSDPKLQAAWKDLCDDKSKTNWSEEQARGNAAQACTLRIAVEFILLTEVCSRSLCGVRILFGFVGNNTETLEVVETGTTGLAGLKTKLKSANNRVLFGALEIDALDKRASVVSKRPKFVAFSCQRCAHFVRCDVLPARCTSSWLTPALCLAPCPFLLCFRRWLQLQRAPACEQLLPEE